MVTRNDIAKLAGVSPATVSYVLNHGPRPVSAETYAKVARVIQQTGYQPNAVARNLRLQRTSTLGLIVPDTQNPYYSEVIRGIERVAFDKDFTVMICHAGYDPKREVQYINMLQMQRVAGVIWIPATTNLEPYQKLVSYGLPMIILDRAMATYKVPVVVADNFRGGYLLTKHLITLGHRRIGAITRPFELSHSLERLGGYKAALRECGLPVEESLIVPGGYQMEDGLEAFLRLMKLDNPPTAVFSYNDIHAIGALRGAYQCNMKVPGDISIAGFDDIPEASFTCPSLTTVNQAKFDMGCQGTELLLDLVEGRQQPTELRIVLDVQLVVRESTGPALHQ